MSSPKIMLVDDEELVLSSLQRSLWGDGYQIIALSSALDALDYLKKDPKVDVIISDHRMPKMTGLELMVEVRRRYPRIVRILLTGHADLDVAIGAINQGNLYRFLTKPWRYKEIKGHIEQALKFQNAVNKARKALDDMGELRSIA